MASQHAIVIGGGASGVLLAYQLLRQGSTDRAAIRDRPRPRLYLIGEHNRAQIVSLQQTANGLDALEQGDQKAIAVALDATLFRNIGDQLVRQKIVLSHASLPGEILTVTVDRLTFAPQMGRLGVNLGLSVKSDKRLLSVGLEVEFVMYFAGVGEILPPTTHRPAIFSANFKLLLVSIEPAISFDFSMWLAGVLSAILSLARS